MLKKSIQDSAMPIAQRLRTARDDLFESGSVADTPGLIRRHAHLVDDYIRTCFEASRVGPQMDMIQNPYAIIALGGYGREEHCLHSDVDLLFLFKHHVPEAAEELIRELVYPLWDIRLEVGYATRSLKECIRMAREDYETLTAVLDARMICGISSVFTDLNEQIQHQIIQKTSKKVIAWLIERNERRHQEFGDSTYMLEPNLKEGNGGLRDYHTMRWIARVRYGLKHIRDFEYQGHLSSAEYSDLMAALSFIWAARNRLHRITKRKCDQLYFEHQEKLAGAMGFVAQNGQSAVERLLSSLHAHTTCIKRQLQLFLFDLGVEKKSRWRKRIKNPDCPPGIIADEGRLGFASSETIFSDPEVLIRIFAFSAQKNLPLSHEALRLVREFNYLLDDRFRRSASVRQAFEAILLAPTATFNVLEHMLNTGILLRLIPEYAEIVDRVQYDAYHLYPVDRHMLRTVHTLKTFGADDDPCMDELCGNIYHGLKRKKLLLLAALLHDIGKARPGMKHAQAGAAAAQAILKRMGYTPREIDRVCFLIEHHLLLIKTATRRNIQDEETAIGCARQIGDANRLKMLYLLTVADSVATGPKAWNHWTAALMREFFLKLLGVIEKGELTGQKAVREMERKKTSLIQSAENALEKQEMRRLFEVMSPRYLLYAKAEDIGSHIRLFRRLGGADFVWDITPDPGLNTRKVVVCAKDRPGLFSKIAGVLTLNGMNILDAQVHTWKNAVALDIFTVDPPPEQIFEEERWRRAEKNLKEALSGGLDLSRALSEKTTCPRAAQKHVSIRPNRVVVDNAGSSFFTIIEVFAYDFPGLLYRITDAITRCGLNISVAKIATKVDQVVDVFYVRDEADAKADDAARVEKIKSEILAVLAANP